MQRVSYLIILILINISLMPTCISVKPLSYEMRNIITVDNEGDGDYTSIKEALTNAGPGDIIEVYSGEYFDRNIHIETENISLNGIPYELGNGNDMGKPFLDGGGTSNLFYIQANGVVFSGFHLENDGGAVTTLNLGGIKDCVISNNDISSTLMSPIFCTQCSNIMIINNSLHHSYWRQGISFTDCVSFTISGNTISYCVRGIYIWNSENNIITDNVISNCEVGINVIGADNMIIHNVIKDNEIGLVVTVPNTVIEQNTFQRNRVHAYFQLGLFLFPHHNTWRNNYWGRPHILPKPIFGLAQQFIPWVQFDWRPALQPHQIT